MQGQVNVRTVRTNVRRKAYSHAIKIDKYKNTNYAKYQYAANGHAT